MVIPEVEELMKRFLQGHASQLSVDPMKSMCL